MKRLHLLLPKSLSDFLETRSRTNCITKSQLLRELIESFLKLPEIQRTKPYKQDWSFTQNITYNCTISNNLYKKIALLAEETLCTRSEIVRFILFQAKQNTVSKIKSISTFTSLQQENQSHILIHINFLLKQKNYKQLCNYIYSFLYSRKENELLSLGKPLHLLNSIVELEQNLASVQPEIYLFKAKMLWYLGRTEEALSVINYIQEKYKDNKAIIVRSQIFRGDMLIDKGNPYISQQIFLELNESQLEESAYYRVKILNKLGLSYFYSDNLDKTKYYYEQAFSLAKKEEEIAITHRYLGNIYYSTLELDLAEKHFRTALSLFDSHSNFNLNEYSKLLITYAEVKMSQADWITAKSYVLRAIAIIKKIQNLPNLAWAKRILSQIYYNLGDEKNAHEMIDNSMQIAQEIGGSAYLANAYRVKGAYLIVNRDFNNGETAIRNSRIFEKALSHNPNYNTATKWFNYLAFHNGKDIDYAQLHRQSDNFLKSKHVRDEAANDYVLGYLYFNSQNIEEKSKGEKILKRLLYECISAGDKSIQFALESTLRFNKFVLL